MSSAVSLKVTGPRVIHSGQEVHLDIHGVTAFKAKAEGWALLALYLNLELPPVGSKARMALCRGGVRSWFQQVTAAGPDITGLDGPWPPAQMGAQHLLISRVWPHTANAQRWQFCLELCAFDAAGKPQDMTCRLLTREVKIVPFQLAS